MRIVWYEIRKAFNWRILLLLALIAVIMYQLFISFYFQHFPNGRPESDDYKLGVALVNKYGNVMDTSAFNQFKLSYDQDVKAADQYIQTRPEFADAGIHNYAEFKNVDAASTEQAQNLHGKVLLTDQADVFWKLQSEEYWIDRYEHKSQTFYGNNTVAASAVPGRIERLQQVVTSKGRMSILPYFVVNNYMNLIEMTAVLIFFSVIVLTGPIYMRDRRNKMIHVQYVSRTGRRLLSKKTVAALISTFVLVTIELSVFFMLYARNKTSMFFASSMNSFMNDRVLWFNLTFFQYIVLTVVALYVLALLVTLLVVWMSSISPNTLTLIGMQVLGAFLAARYMRYYLMTDIGDIRMAPFIHPLAYLLIIIGIATLTTLRWRRERRLDIQ